MLQESDLVPQPAPLQLQLLGRLGDFLERFGLPEDYSLIGARVLALVLTLFLAWLAYFVTKYVLRNIARAVTRRTISLRDDILLDHGIFTSLSHLAPAIIIYQLAPEALAGLDGLAGIVITLTYCYMVFAGVMVLDTVLNAGRDIYDTFSVSRQMPINAFIQVAKLVIYLAGLLWLISILIGKSPLTFLAGLGAATAVLLLVFQGPILGFVAGIQLSANRMLAPGDWITMDRYGLDGDVMEIGLTTVKVRNFDKTISTVPTQSLVNDAFKNWRGMQETGGRRIKRAVNIDMGTIRFMTEEDIAALSKVQQLKPYLDARLEDLKSYNEKRGIDPSSRLNGRRLTNVGTFRAWVEQYLAHHEMISKDLTFLIRQLEPTPHGLPLEIYVFTTTTDWVAYEGIQSDIFDHILAAAPEFGLRIYQQPSGSDVAGLGDVLERPESGET